MKKHINLHLNTHSHNPNIYSHTHFWNKTNKTDFSIFTYTHKNIGMVDKKSRVATKILIYLCLDTHKYIRIQMYIRINLFVRLIYQHKQADYISNTNSKLNIIEVRLDKHTHWMWNTDKYIDSHWFNGF